MGDEEYFLRSRFAQFRQSVHLGLRLRFACPHPGHGLVFANGTPIANSLGELYTLQRYLDPDGLRQRGIEHFDAWAATFGEVV